MPVSSFGYVVGSLGKLRTVSAVEPLKNFT
jgi:hypothetical protein